jgi:hypothetical protein
VSGLYRCPSWVFAYSGHPVLGSDAAARPFALTSAMTKTAAQCRDVNASMPALRRKKVSRQITERQTYSWLVLYESPVACVPQFYIAARNFVAKWHGEAYHDRKWHGNLARTGHLPP